MEQSVQVAAGPYRPCLGCCGVHAAALSSSPPCPPPHARHPGGSARPFHQRFPRNPLYPPGLPSPCPPPPACAPASWVYQKAHMAVAALAAIGMGIGTSFGLLSGVGVSFNFVCQVS